MVLFAASGHPKKRIILWSALLPFCVFNIMHVISGLPLGLSKSPLHYMNYRYIQFPFSFLGAAFSFEHHILSIIIGIFFTLYFLILIFKKFYNKNPFIFALMLFILLTGFVISVGRAHIPSDQSLAGRLRINSTVYGACFFLSLMELSSGKNRLPRSLLGRKRFVILAFAGIAITGCYSLLSYKHKLPDMKKHRNIMRNEVLRCQKKIYYSDWQKNILINSFKNKIYTLKDKLSALPEDSQS